MLHKSWTKEDGEKVVAMSLSSSFHWNGTFSKINARNLQLGLKKVSRTSFSRICRESFSEFSTKKQGDNFTHCVDCDDLKKIRSACTSGSGAYDVYQKKPRTCSKHDILHTNSNPHRLFGYKMGTRFSNTLCAQASLHLEITNPLL